MKVYPFMRYKMWYVGIMSAVTVLAVLAIFVLGLSYGIDFQGGVRAEIRLTQDSTTEQVREALTTAGVQDSVVQFSGNNTYTVTAQEMSDEQFETAIGSMAALGASQAAAGLERVGPSFGKETANRALLAVGIAIILMIAYIAWRFDFKFALPAIASLVHDLGLTLGIYALTGRLVTAATVAAALTILGYSINDTIIVFDRIRENQHFMKTETYSEMADRSISQTLARSINTSLTTLLPLLSILLFGGETLKDFAFALFIGIAAGTYSSIFVASPLLVLWKEREPRYRKRLAAAKSS
ncbi:MAG: protein translocase subunit SecF [Gaiellales bacterium]|nr:protein translocase subunit SecF [Gaiellales bacterium]